jgi:ubiquinone/menaquinone biosynthesis C-methylase UbiE
MPDVYTSIAEAVPDLVDRLADTLEIRAADPAQRAMRDAYLTEVAFPPGARVLEIGCGTGAVARDLAVRPHVAEVVGIDLSPRLLDRARQLSEGIVSLSFEEADGRRLPFSDGVFNVVVMHTLLCHVPGPENVLAEAHRVLRAGGWLAVFDGDYATTSVALGDHDPLQTCAAAAVANLVHDPWLARRLASLGAAAGFAIKSLRNHAYAQTHDPSYFLAFIDLGVDFLVAAGQIGVDLADALKAESRRRAHEGRFYGQISYVSMIAQRSA